MYSSIAIGSIADFLWIVIAALIFTWIFRKLRLPPLLGAIIAGLVLGPSGLNLINLNANPLSHQWLIFLGSIGGLILVFLVGLESNIKEIISFSREGLSIGLAGLFLSFIFIAASAYLLGFSPMRSAILGIALSVSSTIPSLTTIVSMKKGSTRAAKVLGVSSLVDDIFGLILLFLVINAFSGSSLNIFGLVTFLFLLGIFWAFSIFIMPKISSMAYNYFDYPSEQTTTLLTFIFILLAAIVAEDFLYEASFGVFLVGLAFSALHPLYKYEIKRVFLSLGDILLFPIFFVMIGLNADIKMFADPFWLMILGIVVLMAVLGKAIAGIVGKVVSDIDMNEALAVGLALSPRGGISLVIATLALSKGMISPGIFSVIVATVIITMLVAPILTRIGFSRVKVE